ncbi:oxidoreductase [Lactobacillus amylovorus]|uniref:phage antirepressor KilAC domain-containing protein n=1 Tax=Lactobacillus amylovorus TaxID=1604 RepID=UPI0021A4D537|nr:phage antirepressor KilAC domain-containing protein [Lactobacillus amylovorus]MCT3595674.1 oxidoreductase [Lactobacillus amylovorus]
MSDNQLINVTIKNNQQLVSARDLHKGLGLTGRFSRWFKNNSEFFEENTDFYKCTSSTVVNNGAVRVLDDYLLTISMAKQLAMMARTERSRLYREYFLDLERKWNSPQEVVKRGYAILQDENTQLRIENKSMKPKALFADAVSASNKTILIGDLAKILKQNGVNIGSVRLFRWLRKHGYLIKRDASDYNMPTQKSMERKLFVVKETVITHSDGHTTISKTTKVTGKGQIYFVNKFLKSTNPDTEQFREKR